MGTNTAEVHISVAHVVARATRGPVVKDVLLFAFLEANQDVKVA